MALFQGGKLVTGQRLVKADLRAEGEVITQVGELTPRSDEQVFNVAGRYLLPGLIDSHTHFGLKSRNTQTADDVWHGTVAAACGGVTTVIDYADQQPSSLLSGVEQRLAEFAPAAVDYNLHLVLNSRYHPGLEGELEAVRDRGVTSIKVFTTYKDRGYMLCPDQLPRLLTACRRVGLVVTVHAEDDSIIQWAAEQGRKQGRLAPRDHPRLRPVAAELQAVNRLCELAGQTGCPVYIVHLSSGHGCEQVRKARERGLPVLAETAPHYLVLDSSRLEGGEGALWLMTPPLREEIHSRQLWQGLADGTIAVVATDHCAFARQQKLARMSALDILPGIPGVETMLPLLYTYGVVAGRVDLVRLVALVSANPARIFGLWPRKGNLSPGADADIVVYNPDCHGALDAAGLHSRAGYSPYQGMPVRGRVELTMVRGTVVAAGGKFLGRRGHGQFVPGGLCDTSL